MSDAIVECPVLCLRSGGVTTLTELERTMESNQNGTSSGKRRILAHIPQTPSSPEPTRAAAQENAPQETPPQPPKEDVGIKVEEKRQRVVKGGKPKKADYALLTEKIIAYFRSNGVTSFSKKEIVKFCDSIQMDTGNWGSLMRYLRRGDGSHYVDNDVNRGPNSTYKLVSGGVAQRSPVREKKNNNYTELAHMLVEFMDSLLDKEVSKAEIIRFFKEKNIKLGSWMGFTRYMKEGDANYTIVTNGQAGRKCRYLLKPRDGVVAPAVKRRSPVVPPPKKTTAKTTARRGGSRSATPESGSAPEKKPAVTKPTLVKSPAIMHPVLPAEPSPSLPEPVAFQPAPQPEVPQEKSTMVRVAPGEKVAITIKIEIG